MLVNLVYPLLMLFALAMLVFGFYRLIIGVRQVRAFIKDIMSKKVK